MRYSLSSENSVRKYIFQIYLVLLYFYYFSGKNTGLSRWYAYFYSWQKYLLNLSEFYLKKISEQGTLTETFLESVSDFTFATNWHLQ